MNINQKSITKPNQYERFTLSEFKLIGLLALLIIVGLTSWSIGGLFFKELSIGAIIIFLLMINKKNIENNPSPKEVI